jgi:ubiquinone/menaquinone biosynthesis C-methylase UbiE
MTETPHDNPFDTMLEAYLKWAEPVSAEFARAALDRADLPSGSEVLDVCAGSGALAVAAARAGHRVRGIDVSQGMLGVLGKRLAPFPGCAAESMDALELRYANDSFDATFSVLGVMFFGDAVPATLKGLVRVTRPGGQVAVVHWANTRGAPIFTLLARALERLADPDVDPLAELIGDEYLGPAKLDRALSQAGCVEVSTIALEVENPLPEPEVALDELHTIFLRHPQYRSLADEQRDRLRSAFAEEVRSATSSADGTGLRAFSHLTLGRVPR